MDKVYLQHPPIPKTTASQDNSRDGIHHRFLAEIIS